VAAFEITGYRTLSELEEGWPRLSGRLGFIAGGTDFINRLRQRGVEWDVVVDLSQTTDLRYIREAEGWIRIGAGVTFTEIAESPLLREKAVCLAQAAAEVGSVQIRNRATMAGNVAGGSPAADSLPPLTVLRAVARVLGRVNGRIVRQPDRAIDTCGQTLQPDELIVEIRFPVPGPSTRTGFRKLGARTRVSIARISMAMSADYDAEAGRIRSGSIALGALAEEPLCPDDLRDFLQGRSVDHVFAMELCDRLTGLVDGAIPDRPSRPYKRLAVRGLALDLLTNLFRRPFDL